MQAATIAASNIDFLFVPKYRSIIITLHSYVCVQSEQYRPACCSLFVVEQIPKQKLSGLSGAEYLLERPST
jgi:hypothetical protein